MTKLKKKKSKKRTKRVFSLESLSREDEFSEFQSAIKRIRDENGAITKKISPQSVLWGLPEGVIQSGALLREVAKSPKSVIPDLKQLTDVSEIYELPNVTDALEILMCVIQMTRKPAKFDAVESASLVRSIYDAVNNEDDELLIENPVVHQVLYGEIPLIVGVQFPVLDVAEELVENAKTQLIAAIEELLDGDGLPNAKLISQTGLLLACWTRCCTLCDLDNRECFDVDAQTQFEYFVRQMMRLIRKDGTLVFSDDGVDLREPIQSALKCYFDDEDSAVASVVFGKHNGRGSIKKAGKSKRVSLNALPESSAYSEWAEIACLRSEWIPNAPKLTVAFCGRKLMAELATDSVLFSGEIRNRFLVDNQLHEVVSDWEVVCWHSDQDGDFLELECDLDGGAKWQKHFLLARNETFMLTGDVLLGKNGERVRIEGQWSLGRDTGFGASQETRELFLTHQSKTASAVLPISFPEWRVERTESDLSISNGELLFQTEGSGCNLYFPLVIDLDPKRCRKPLTWRQLTVAEKLEQMPRSQAAAFRVHIGSQQWLIYRSLTSTANRTFLGQNLNVEFYVGTLEEDGTSCEIISVD